MLTKISSNLKFVLAETPVFEGIVCRPLYFQPRVVFYLPDYIIISKDIHFGSIIMILYQSDNLLFI